MHVGESSSSSATRAYIGLMSGTSMDGVDAVLLEARWEQATGWHFQATHAHHVPMPPPLRQACLDLNRPGPNELHQAALAANALSQWYASAVAGLLVHAQRDASSITALGAHGQTVRHCPPVSSGTFPTLNTAWTAYTVQLLNPALLAELTGITVTADFRSRDVAAGGQGAPLVPAFHQAVFADPQHPIAVLNLGGMANLTVLTPQGTVSGFDTGPGNALLDAWCERHTGQTFDADGRWAATGTPQADLLAHWLADPYFHRSGPRSTGRDHFHEGWVHQGCALMGRVLSPEDVQATLLDLTVHSIAHALSGVSVERVVVCGGGVFNAQLMSKLRHALAPVAVVLSDACGLPAMHVEAAAFGWLAHQTLMGDTGNVVQVTGARGPRILGAIYQ
jgi:anhydro-N-acetylmuramic acid kinase